MKKTLLYLCIWLLMACSAHSGSIYSASFGDKNDPAVIFLHGGPGYNSYSFEQSTAQKLASQGYYVIVYDQRGCGRSKGIANSRYTFQEAFNDIDSIYKKYDIHKATLIGHSWGGTLGVLYAEKEPDKVNNLILADAPLSYQKVFRTILSKCRKIYTEQKSEQLKYIDMLDKMDTASLDYSSYCFMHAMSCNFYKPQNPSPEATALYKKLKESKNASLLSDMTKEPVAGFFKNEKYTLLNLTSKIQQLQGKVRVFGIYGKEDGLFDESNLNNIKQTLGEKNFALIDDASHSVFIDSQEKFIETVNTWIKG